MSLRQALEIGRRAVEAARGGEGVVITTGTDTMEELAVLCAMLHGAQAPIVLTGANRPGSAPGADGAANLVDAFEWARGNGGDPTNMSWGSTCGGAQDFMSRYVDWAVRNLSATIVIAAGNHDGRCSDAAGDQKVSSPGIAWSVITVGSSGTYTVTITTPEGYSGSAAVKVTVNTAAVPVISRNRRCACAMPDCRMTWASSSATERLGFS